MSWDALDRWGPVALGDVVSGGARNDVRTVEIGGRRAVARLGARTDADLEWEARLLRHLAASGVGVPELVPTLDGRSFAHGITVMELVGGRHPSTVEDWTLVAEQLRALHRVTAGWAQRPGWASSIDLLTRDGGTSVDLTAMPADGVARCRAAWARLAHEDCVVVHGDPNPGNVFIADDRVVLVDWDEARVDAPALDLVLPYNAAGLSDDALAAAAQAVSAWEAAVCWSAEPEYARRRLDEVRST